MSSFVVEDQLINRVVATLAEYRGYGSYPLIQTIAKEQGFDLRGDGGCRQLAEAMFALNVNAVEQRYGAGQAAEFRPLDFQWREEPPAPLMQAYKSPRLLAVSVRRGRRAGDFDAVRDDAARPGRNGAGDRRAAAGVPLRLEKSA